MIDWIPSLKNYCITSKRTNTVPIWMMVQSIVSKCIDLKSKIVCSCGKFPLWEKVGHIGYHWNEPGLVGRIQDFDHSLLFGMFHHIDSQMVLGRYAGRLMVRKEMGEKTS